MITLDDNLKEPLYLQIYNQLKTNIITGVLSNGAKLPPTRVLAKDLEVGRNTVENAYAQLCSEGYISSRMGSGFIVNTIDTFLHPLPAQTKHEKHLSRPIKNPQENTKFNFEYGRLNPDEFPIKIWRKYMNQALTTCGATFLVSYNDRQGEWGLRAEIMKYLNMSRGVQCHPDQIVLCCGTLQSLDLICHLVNGHSTEIAIEEPAYEGAREVFRSNDYKVLPIQVGKNGINLEILAETNAKIVYVTPSHQFPTGAVMPIQQRLKLLDWAKKNNSVILEDDYDGELRYNTKPIPSLQSLDTNGSVIYLGTFSKTLGPGLRLNYVVLPEVWLKRYHEVLDHYHSPVPWLQQKTLELFISKGDWERHLRKLCISQKKKHDLLIKTVGELMGENVKIHGQNAGLHVLLEFEKKKEKELIEQAQANGVKVYPVSKYWINPEQYFNNMVLLGYSSLTEQDIYEGLMLLNQAWFSH